MKVGDRVRIKAYKSIIGTIKSLYTKTWGNNYNPAWNIRLDDGTLNAYYEDSLELIPSTNSSPSALFNVGDTVKVKAGVYAGSTANLLKVFNIGANSYWQVVLDDGRNDYIYENCLESISNTTSSPSFVKGDTVHIKNMGIGIYDRPNHNISGFHYVLFNGSDYIVSELDLSHVNKNPQVNPHMSNSSFKVGDKVLVNFNNLSNSMVDKPATLVKQVTSPADCWDIVFDDGTKDMMNECYFTHNTKSATTSTSQGVNNPFGWVSYVPVSFGGQSVQRTSTVGVDFAVEPKVEKQSCTKHSWRFYQGLNSRFEYCEVCDVKRDTDKRV